MRRVFLRDALRRFPSTELQVAVEVEARRPRRQRVSTIPPTVACHGLIGLQDVARCWHTLLYIAVKPPMSPVFGGIKMY